MTEDEAVGKIADIIERQRDARSNCVSSDDIAREVLDALRANPELAVAALGGEVEVAALRFEVEKWKTRATERRIAFYDLVQRHQGCPVTTGETEVKP